MKIGIIGAGIGGIATAARLASRGYEVDVYEANPYPGGKLSEFWEGDFRFDAGPSLFTMPHYVEELFHAAGEDPNGYFQYQRVPVVCNYFWEDGTRLAAHADPDKFARAINQSLGVEEAVAHKILRKAAYKYDTVGHIFLERSLHRADTWLTKEVAYALTQVPFLDLTVSMNKANEKITDHPKLVQLLNRFATYNGSDPYQAPGLLNMIPHFEHGIGAFFPEGGMFNITKSLWQLAQRKGTRFHFSQPVEKIMVENKAVKGLVVKGKLIPYDLIVSNMDVFYTYKKLLPDQKHPKRSLNQQKSTSALIFYWGINRRFPELDLHNIFFSEDYREEFRHLAEGKIFEDPTVYVNIGSKYSPEDAPPNTEGWFTMINVPYNQGQDWKTMIKAARSNIIAKLNRILKIDLGSLIICENSLDPRSIEQKTSSHLGALYGSSSNNPFAAFIRHPNFSRKIKNLYFCGGSVHPGGGIPLSLLSAKIVDQLIHPA